MKQGQGKEVNQRLGVGNRGVSPARTAQIGLRVGNHVSDMGPASNTGYRGDGPLYQGGALRPAEMGNANAQRSAGVKNGAGCDRTLYGQSGANKQYGAAASGNPPKRGPLFPGWE